ncbi:MAG: cytochrome b [Sphingomonas bacterium]|nr:cytochrome b [Sphingomonas bacterium]
MADYMVEETSGARAIRYGNLAVAIHWLSAALILTQIYLGFAFGNFPKGSAERAELFTAHKTVGVVILLLALTRLAVRLIDAPPPYPAHFPKWERRVAVWSHRTLYFLMIALPVTGLAAVSKGANGGMTELAGGTWFPVVPIPALGGAHEVLAFAMIGLLGLHILAALKNQFVTGGPVAGRMPPFRATDKG